MSFNDSLGCQNFISRVGKIIGSLACVSVFLLYWGSARLSLLFLVLVNWATVLWLFGCLETLTYSVTSWPLLVESWVFFLYPWEARLCRISEWRASIAMGIPSLVLTAEVILRISSLLDILMVGSTFSRGISVVSGIIAFLKRNLWTVCCYKTKAGNHNIFLFCLSG